MSSMAKIISSHSKSSLTKASKREQAPSAECNCHKKEKCTLSGKCQICSVFYQSTVKRQDKLEKQTYIGLNQYKKY